MCENPFIPLILDRRVTNATVTTAARGLTSREALLFALGANDPRVAEIVARIVTSHNNAIELKNARGILRGLVLLARAIALRNDGNVSRETKEIIACASALARRFNAMPALLAEIRNTSALYGPDPIAREVSI